MILSENKTPKHCECNYKWFKRIFLLVYEEFESLLQEQAPIDSFIEWLDRVLDETIIQASHEERGSVRRKAQRFLLVWSAFSTRIIRDMTLQSAQSFGESESFRMLSFFNSVGSDSFGWPLFDRSSLVHVIDWEKLEHLFNIFRFNAGSTFFISP